MNNTQSNSRNYGIDVLRIISMFMIVTIHVLGDGGLINNSGVLNIKSETLWGLDALFLCAVNCFALISGYVGLKSKHNISSIVKLCIQVVFYSLIMSLVYILVCLTQKKQINLLYLIECFFPTIFKNYWYFSAYFCLFFFMPLLNYIIETFRKKYLKLLFVFIVIVFCTLSMFVNVVSNLNRGYSVLWLALLYCIGAYNYKYGTFKKMSTFTNISLFFICFLLMLTSRIAISYFSYNIWGEYKYTNILITYTAPTTLFASISLLNIFKKIKIHEKCSKFIVTLSATTFGIYILHCHPYFAQLFLMNKFIFLLNHSAIVILFATLLISLIIFLFCATLDFLRIQFFKLIKIDRFSSYISMSLRKLLYFFIKEQDEDSLNIENQFKQ